MSRTTPARQTQTTFPAARNPAGAADSISLQPPQKASAPREDAIRTRAYALWQQAGEPGSDGVEFWLRAEQELKRREG
jgi:hypothetical protein